MQILDNILHENNTKDFSNSDFIDTLNQNALNFIYLGKQDYHVAWDLQKKINELNKSNKIPDIVLFLEHDDVYTFGKNADKDYLLNTHPDAEIIQSDRGGQVTYHGPGQLVGYPIINLNNYKKSVSWFIKSLQNIIIETLLDFKIHATVKEGFPGVWVDDDKICAMGVRISKWVTMHGFALNVNPNMKFFDGMIPCGILDYGVTSMDQQLNEKILYSQLIEIISEKFNKIFIRDEL